MQTRGKRKAERIADYIAHNQPANLGGREFPEERVHVDAERLMRADHHRQEKEAEQEPHVVTVLHRLPDILEEAKD